MGRLKEDHSGWRTHGLWKKYQHPQVVERQSKFNKRDTKKWCRGKVGIEHVWHRYQERRWNDSLWAYTRSYIHIKCVACRKEKYVKTARSADYTLHIFVEQDSQFELIPISMNGEYLSVDYWKYQGDKKWCSSCGYWH